MVQESKASLWTPGLGSDTITSVIPPILVLHFKGVIDELSTHCGTIIHHSSNFTR
jgi:hypothetical protein